MTVSGYRRPARAILSPALQGKRRPDGFAAGRSLHRPTENE